jgi:hypothetical protein
MNNHTHTQYTSVLPGNPNWEKTTKWFILYVLKNYIHWKNQIPSSNIHLMYVPTHQLLVSRMYPICTSTKSPHQFHHPNMICNSVIELVYMITYLQTFLNFNNKRLTFSSNVSLVSQD